MGNFYTDTIKKDPQFGSTKRITDLKLLEPVTRKKVQELIKDAADQGIKLMVYETFRSQTRQTRLFAQGATQLKTVRVHHYGLACHLVKDINGEPSWKGDFRFMQKLAKKMGSFGVVTGADPLRPRSRSTLYRRTSSIAF